MKLSEELYTKRSENQLTQPKVAEQIGISTQTYCYLEQGKYKRKLTPLVAGKLGKYLGVSALDVEAMFKEEVK